MNQQTRSHLLPIFAKQISKQVSDLTTADLTLFDDWIASGLAVEFIPDIQEKLAIEALNTFDIPTDDINVKVVVPQIDNKYTTRCRNCQSLVVDIKHAKAFGAYDTLRLSVHCGYWYTRNKQGYANNLHQVNLNDVSCTRLIRHKNVFDLHNIDISDIEEFEIEGQNFSSLPVRDLIDKGYSLTRIDGVFTFVKDDSISENSND